MVAPLTVLALVWDRRDWGAGRLLAAMTRPVRVGARQVPLASVLSGALLAAMGVLTLVLAANGPDMGQSGWQLQVTAALGHTATAISSGLAWLPGWASTLTVFAALIAVAYLAVGRGPTPTVGGPPVPSQDPAEQADAQNTPTGGLRTVGSATDQETAAAATPHASSTAKALQR